MPDPPDPSGLPRPDRRPRLRLAELTAGTELVRVAGWDPANEADAPDRWVGGITLDSRLVDASDVYVALPGQHTHGARFTPAAVDRGSVAVLTDPTGADMIDAAATASGVPGGPSVPVIAVADPRAVMGPWAARLYGHPAAAMTMIGITGTNGKTTTAFLVEAALRRTGRRVGVIGTLGFRLDGVDLGGARTTVTTPESVDLQALLALFRDRGVDSVVMEVSSHALALHRVAGIRFDAAAFTNLGRDHLDFHADMEDYFAAKASLFGPEMSRSAVVNVDDAYGRRLLDQLAGTVPAVTTSSRPDTDPPADWQVTAVDTGPGASRVQLAGPHGDLTFRLGLPGSYNVDNAVTALALVDAVGVDARTAALGLAEAAVPGRMQLVDLGPGAPAVVVDFAHTPQAVTAALAALDGDPLVVVLGCGGDRDRAKRRPMGAAAADGADLVVVTDDNPRSEDPAAIRAEVLSGVRAAGPTRAREVLDGGDRRSAIRTALAAAHRSGSPRGVVAILGKGHEPGQQVTGPDGAAVVHPFDDVQVAAEEWRVVVANGSPFTVVAGGQA